MAERLGRLVIPIGKSGMGEGVSQQRAFHLPGEKWNEEDAWLRGFLNGPRPGGLARPQTDLTSIMNIFALKEKLKQQALAEQPILQALELRKKK